MLCFAGFLRFSQELPVEPGRRVGMEGEEVEVVYEMDGAWLRRVVERSGRGFRASRVEGVLEPFVAVWVEGMSRDRGRVRIRLCVAAFGAMPPELGKTAGAGEALFYRAEAVRRRDEMGGEMRNALVWYRKAATGGHLGGMCNWGWCLENGVGVEVDKAAGVEWYRKAAAGGQLDAVYKLAMYDFAMSRINQPAG